MSVKLERLGHIFTEEISKIIHTELRDESFGFITITYTKISSDLSYAKVYFTLLDTSRKDEIGKALNKASGFIRSKLCENVEIRKMPEINFVYDESIDYGDKIENIIDKLKEDKNE